MFQLTSAENSYPDYKTPVQYILKNKREGDILIMEHSVSQAYLFNEMEIYFLKDLQEEEDIKMISNLLEKNESVWFLNTIINDERYHFKKRNGLVRKFLEANEENLVYIGNDNLSKVYFFSKK